MREPSSLDWISRFTEEEEHPEFVNYKRTMGPKGKHQTSQNVMEGQATTVITRDGKTGFTVFRFIDSLAFPVH